MSSAVVGTALERARGSRRRPTPVWSHWMSVRGRV